MKYLAFLILLAGCSGTINQPEQDKDEISVPDGIKHSLFENAATMYLPEKYERYNLKELHAILKAEDGNPLIKQLFNETIIRFYASTGHSGYVFMDTISYQHYLVMSELPARTSPVRKEYSSKIAQQLKGRSSMQLGIPEAELRTKVAKYGSQKTFEHVYIKVESRNTTDAICSEHFAISHKNKSYILDVLSMYDTDLEYLKNNITFQ